MSMLYGKWWYLSENCSMMLFVNQINNMKHFILIGKVKENQQ